MTVFEFQAYGNIVNQVSSFDDVKDSEKHINKIMKLYSDKYAELKKMAIGIAVSRGFKDIRLMDFDYVYTTGVLEIRYKGR